MRRTTAIVAPLVLGLFLASIPQWAPRFWIYVMTQALVFAIFAMSLDLLLGYGGMPSFGHAAYYGIGAYATAMVAPKLTGALLPVLLVAALAAGAFATPIGALALRTRGIYFLMLTLAFAQMLWGLSVNWIAVTKGTDGIINIPRPTLPGLDALGISFWQRGPFFYLVLAVAVVTYLLLLAVVSSPFGRTLEGIRENEERMRALGCPTYRYRLAAFVISCALAGVAGAMAAFNNGFANPGLLYWTGSGLVLIACIVGGIRSLVGPALGAIAVLIVELALSAIPFVPVEAADHWQLVLGALFIAIVLFLPGGIAGLVRRYT